MKRLLIMFLFISTISSCADQNGSARIEILKVLEEQRKAWNQGDIEGYMQGYLQSDSLVFIGKSGPKYGWRTTLENYKKAYPDKAAMGVLTFDIKKVSLINSDHAFVVGGWHLKRQKDEPYGYFTLLFERVAGEWKIVADHSS